MLGIKACSQSGPTPETAYAAGNVSLQKMCSLRWEQHFGVMKVNEFVAQLQLDSQGKGWAFGFQDEYLVSAKHSVLCSTPPEGIWSLICYLRMLIFCVPGARVREHTQ